MPSTLPATAPISRRSVSARTRSSKTMTAPAADSAADRAHPASRNAEGMKEVTNPGKQGNKKKTNKNEIHRKPTSAGARENEPGSAQFASMPTPAPRSSSGKIVRVRWS